MLGGTLGGKRRAPQGVSAVQRSQLPHVRLGHGHVRLLPVHLERQEGPGVLRGDRVFLPGPLLPVVVVPFRFRELPGDGPGLRGELVSRRRRRCVFRPGAAEILGESSSRIDRREHRRRDGVVAVLEHGAREPSLEDQERRLHLQLPALERELMSKALDELVSAELEHGGSARVVEGRRARAFSPLHVVFARALLVDALLEAPLGGSPSTAAAAIGILEEPLNGGVPESPEIARSGAPAAAPASTSTLPASASASAESSAPSTSFLLMRHVGCVHFVM